MAAVSLRLPDSIYKFAKELSSKDSVSLNQFIATAVAEKVSALNTEVYLQERASNASKNKFMKALSKVPDIEAQEFDKI
ncbi:MAG: toxin-antitoxin system HicB family antitoxin [Campylobacterota bacterium]|nr:toxin-antitoxin system HicB family antitoxin [Campylobacterota bacterium]